MPAAGLGPSRPSQPHSHAKVATRRAVNMFKSTGFIECIWHSIFSLSLTSALHMMNAVNSKLMEPACNIHGAPDPSTSSALFSHPPVRECLPFPSHIHLSLFLLRTTNCHLASSPVHSSLRYLLIPCPHILGFVLSLQQGSVFF